MFVAWVATNTAKNYLKKKAIQLVRGIDYARKTQVIIGIPEENDVEHEGGMKNSQLLYLHCMGSPARHIPPRNVMKALEQESVQKQMKKHIRKGIRLALFTDLDAAKMEYERAGMIGANAVKAQFGIIPPPNAPSTIAKKGSSATLIDTGALRQAVGYTVNSKKII